MSDTLVRMPKLADTLVEGTLGQWLKQVGETIGQGEPLASIETDKITTDLPSPAAGTLLEILVPEGQTVPVETVIARIGAVVAQAADTPALEPSTPLAQPPIPPAAEPRSPAPRPTPVAARLLAEHGLTAAQVPSRSGRLTKNEVLNYVKQDTHASGPASDLGPPGLAAGPAPEVLTYLKRDTPASGPAPDRRPPGLAAGPAPEVLPYLKGNTPASGPAPDRRPPGLAASVAAPSVTGTLIPLTPMRRAIADHMSRARQTIPHGQTVLDADLSTLVAWRDLRKAAFLQAEQANLSFTVCFVYALARALAVDTGGPVDIGVAVAVEAGLIVPVLRNADALGLGATARGIAELAARARNRTLTPPETLGARITVTNVGSFGNLSAAPIIPVDQFAILGPGLVERRPMPAPNGAIRPGWNCRLCLMFDRRALDDLAADQLLRRIVAELLRIPEAAD